MTDERRKEIEARCDESDRAAIELGLTPCVTVMCRELLAENAELRELVRQLSERCHAQSEALSRRAEGDELRRVASALAEAIRMRRRWLKEDYLTPNHLKQEDVEAGEDAALAAFAALEGKQ